MANCPFCKKKVNSTALRCPYCTSHLEGNAQWELSKKIEGIGCLIMIVLVVGFVIYIKMNH